MTQPDLNKTTVSDSECKLALAPPRYGRNRVDSFYDPCKTGIHFCGQTPCAQPYTALNIPADSEAAALALFERLRIIAECDDEAGDYCVDLQINDDCSEDFWTNSQLFPLIVRELTPVPSDITPN